MLIYSFLVRNTDGNLDFCLALEGVSVGEGCGMDTLVGLSPERVKSGAVSRSVMSELS